jgi:hypothetical protein
MTLDNLFLASIIESFSITTGFPTFIVDRQGNIELSSRGFQQQDFRFADVEQIEKFLATDELLMLDTDQHYTYLTDNLFI